MTRTSYWPLALIGAVAAVLGHVGCTRTYETAEPKPAEAEKAPATVIAAPSPASEKGPRVFAEWSAKPPAAVLLISGEQDGYPDPCGCTDGQLGGLGRRFDFLEKIQAKGWPVAKVDLGNLILNPASSRGGIKQETIKLKVILRALAEMKYDAVALGPEDLKLGVQEVAGELLNLKEPRFVAANVKPTAGLEEILRPIVIAKAGPVTIGVTAVLDKAAFEALRDPGAAQIFEVKPADDVIPGVLDELGKRAEVKVLLVQGPPEEAKRLAEKFSGFDLVVGTSENADPDERPQTLDGGKTLLVNSIGKKGKHVGVVGIFPGSTPRLVYRRQSLDGKNFRQAEPMRKLIDGEYQEMLRAEGVVENFPRFANGQAPTGAQYVGAKACQECHPKTFEKWTTTKHARGYDALLNPKRNRESDAECISCHTTGFGYKSGWVSAEKTPYLKGNQCENCHGPASLHAAEPDKPEYRKPMAMTAESANANNFCTRCHDEDNDHNFKFDARYAQIFHKGLDDYADPRVHRSRPVKPGDGGQ